MRRKDGWKNGQKFLRVGLFGFLAVFRFVRHAFGVRFTLFLDALALLESRPLCS
jgi:hypothetical protein